MQPIVHLAVGYLCYAALVRYRHGRAPRDAPAVVVLFAALLPDLIDKPLASAGVVPVGRTVAHSLLIAVPLVVAVWLVADRRGRPTLGVAFAVGYLSHVAADVPWHVLSGAVDELGFLLWPLTEMPAYTGVKPLGEVAGLSVTTLWIEAVVLLVGFALWIADGLPGIPPASGPLDDRENG